MKRNERNMGKKNNKYHLTLYLRNNHNKFILLFFNILILFILNL